MASNRVGRIYVELDLDKSRYMRAQQTLVRESATGARVLERNFRNLGIRSGATFDLMRNQAIQSFNAIRRSGRATDDDLVRAARARAARIRQINEQQYGRHKTMLDKMKEHWKMYATMVIAAVGLAMRKVLTEYAGFEVALNRLGNVSDESIGSMREKILNIVPALGSVTELTKGYYQVMSAGVTEPLRAMDLLRVSAKMSQEATVEQGEAVKGIASLMSAYKNELISATKAADLLYKTEALGIIEVGALVPLIGDLANKAKAVGLSADEMASSLAQVSTTGAGASIAVTQLQSLLKSLSKGFNKLPESVKKFGSTINAVKAIGFQGVLREMWAATDGNATAIQNMLGRAEAYSAYLQLSKNDFAGYIDRLEQMANKAGAFDDAWKRFSITLTSVWEEFKNTVGREVVLLGEELAPAIKIVVKDMSSWIEQNHEYIGQKTHEAVNKITNSIETMIAAYNLLPDGVIGAAGTGILVRILTGSTPLGKAAAALYLLNVQLENFGVNMKKVGEYSERAINPLGVMLRSLATIEKSPFFGGGSAGEISGAGRGFDIPSKPPSKPKPVVLSDETMAEAKARAAALAKAMKEQLKIMEEVAEQVRKQIKKRKDFEQRLRDDIYKMDVKYRDNTEAEIRRVEKLRISALEAERDKHAEVVKDKDLLNQWYGKRLALITAETTAKIKDVPAQKVEISQLEKFINMFGDSGEVFKGQVDEAGKIIMESTTGMNKVITGAGKTFGASSLAAGLNFAVAIGEAVIAILGVIEDIINLPRRMVDAFTSLLNTIGNWGSMLTDALDAFVDSIYNMITGIGDIFTKLIPKLIALVPEILKAALDAIPVLVDAIIDSVPLIVNALVKGIASMQFGKDIATSASKAYSSFMGTITGFDFVLKGLKSVFGGGRKRKYLGGEMDVGYEGGLPSATMTKSYAKRVGAGARTETEQTMMDTAINVLKGYQELVESMGEGVSNTFYANVKDMSVSVYAKATRSAALARRFGKSLEKMAEELQEQLDIYLGEAIRQYGQGVIAATGDIDFLKPSADIFAQASMLQRQMMDSADMSTEELTELSKDLSNLSKAVEGAIQTWDDIQYQIDVAAGTLSQFEQDIYNTNKQFDDWRKQMIDLGATVKALTKIEEKRKEVLTHMLVLPFESLLDTVMGQITERTRADWTMSDYMDAIQNIQHDPRTEEYRNEALSLFNDMLGAMGDVVSSIDNAIKTLQHTLNDLLFTDLAAVQSAESFQNEYTRLLNDVLTVTDPARAEEAAFAFTNFVPIYLDWMKNYSANYVDLVDQAAADIRAAMDTIAGLGEQTTAAEEAVDWLTKIAGLLEEVIEKIGMSEFREQVETLKDLINFHTDAGAPPYYITMLQNSLSDLFARFGVTPDQFATGGLTSGVSIAGERGPEWVVPTYEPERSSFLQSVGADPDTIGKAIARHLGSDGQEINVNVYIDGQPIRSAVTAGLRGRDTELIQAVRRAA